MKLFAITALAACVAGSPAGSGFSKRQGVTQMISAPGPAPSGAVHNHIQAFAIAIVGVGSNAGIQGDYTTASASSDNTTSASFDTTASATPTNTACASCANPASTTRNTTSATPNNTTSATSDPGSFSTTHSEQAETSITTSHGCAWSSSSSSATGAGAIVVTRNVTAVASGVATETGNQTTVSLVVMQLGDETPAATATIIAAAASATKAAVEKRGGTGEPEAPVPDVYDPGVTLCRSTGAVALKLVHGLVFDANHMFRQVYVAGNGQLQLDGPPQSGALATAGFFVAGGVFGLGHNTIWWSCSIDGGGDLTNIYAAKIADYCRPVFLRVYDLDEC